MRATLVTPQMERQWARDDIHYHLWEAYVGLLSRMSEGLPIDLEDSNVRSVLAALKDGLLAVAMWSGADRPAK